MANSDVGTKTDTGLDLPIVKSTSFVEDLHKSRRNLRGYKESRRDSESVKARAEVEELTLLIEKSNRGVEFQSKDMEVLKIEEKYADVMRVLEVVKEEVSRLKLDMESGLGERSEAEKEVEKLRFRTEGNWRLLESLKKETEVVNEELLLAELGKIEAFMEYEEIERQREGRGKEVLDLLVEKNKRIKEMLEEVGRSKDIEKELFETCTDVEMLETQLKLVKKLERRVQREDNGMSRSNRSFERGLSVLKEVTEATEAKKEELASANAELFQLMTVMDELRNEISQANEETASFEKILRKDDGKIQKLNGKMVMAKSKLEAVSIAKERVSSLADNLVGSLEKLKKNKEAAKKEELLLKEDKMVTKAETLKTKLEIDENERELISKFIGVCIVV